MVFIPETMYSRQLFVQFGNNYNICMPGLEFEHHKEQSDFVEIVLQIIAVNQCTCYQVVCSKFDVLKCLIIDCQTP